jgi:hypothetical protein
MFDWFGLRALREENQQLKEQLSMQKQIRDSVSKQMMRLTIAYFGLSGQLFRCRPAT